MSTDRTNDSLSDEQVSALLDGELETPAMAQVCAAWRQQPAVRASWHAYHLIGDVLRSDDLASTAERDAAFLHALRGRLAQEPVVLAPAPRAAAAVPRSAAVSRMRRWRASAAVAAGFVAVAGVLVVTRTPVTPVETIASTAPPNLTSIAPVAQPGVTPVAMPAPAVVADAPPVVVTGKLIRDARLDRYLSAHQQFAGTSALGVPSAFLRSATTDASNR
jgi:sigma-E factor negative regulatory protein RseA